MPTASLLVVDDDAASLSAMQAILQPLGQRVVLAQSGDEALRKVLADDFAVIFMDVKMPGLDGHETARLIKARERSAHVPIIFVTAYGKEDVAEERGREQGAVGYFLKPFDPDVLRCRAAVFVELHLRGLIVRERQVDLRFRRLTDLMPLCLWVAAPDGALSYCNQMWTQFSGLTVDTSGSLGGLAGVHPGDRPRARAAWLRAKMRPATYETELRLRRRDGHYRWHLARAVPELDGDGRLTHWIATATDIHDEKEAEEANARLLVREREARAEAEAANRAKDEFLATLSHELRTPLNTILGWTHILRKETPDAATTARVLETLERSARSLRQMIEDILDVSGIVAGKLVLDVGRVELAAVVAAALDAVRPSATAKGLTLQPQIEDLDPCAGDGDRMGQVVLNLLTNAIKFTPAGGRIDVALARRGADAELTIEDTGVGIPPEFLPHVFERFRQADISTARPFGGLGLGLAIARHIVELHGGTVTAESQGTGRGARFTVTLPLRPAAEAPPRPDASPTPSVDDTTLRGVTVMVVDDSEDVRLLIAEILQRRGATCILAGGADEALAELDRTRPDVLISDIGLPREDGFSLIRRVREHARGALPAAALTAYASADDSRRVLDAGFQMHLKKPISQEALVLAVARLVGRQGR